ncbi:MAG: hypothetical protein OEV95_12710, partial [Gemmatimonadota bacterium]|nr:hypothetical protein [Gemmatimonadota bacterium]
GVPHTGYTINNLFAAFAADMDVSDAGANYASVNLPFALGNTYDHFFSQPSDWLFDPAIFGAPFFPGVGFVGVKYLKSPTGPGAIQLFSNTINGSPFAGAVNDPRDVVQLYRYLSGTQSTAAGDQACQYNPTTERLCFINNTSPQDMRFFQSSTPLTLAPGEGGSIVVAYIFAPPVPSGNCPSPACDVKPGDPRFLTSVGQMSAFGVNTLDTLTGFVDFNDANGNNIPEQPEFTVVPGSLLGKSLTAQAVFDAKFLLPFAPSSPEFFLIPGDNKVSVMWKQSISETSGDPYFSVASAPTVFDPSVGATVANALYDPNYRFNDVEGYRVYRGRVDAPNELALLAQFDYAGTVISDHTGIVNPNPNCAPEFGILANCPAPFPDGGNKKDGTLLTVAVDYDIVDQVVQVKAGSGRAFLANNTALLTKTDTLLTSGATLGGCGPRSACPAPSNTGIPFVYVDNTVRNSFRYFYAVTSFDVNSIESGPTSLESPRNTKSVTPVKPASNANQVGDLQIQVFGRGTRVDNLFPTPTIDPVTGIFSGPQPSANGGAFGFAGEFLSQVVGGSGAVLGLLDSVKPGQVDLSGCCGGSDPSGGKPVTYYWRVLTATDTLNFVFALQQDLAGEVSAEQFFDAVTTDSALASRYGGDGTYVMKAALNVTIPTGPKMGDWGLGIALGEPGLGTSDRYNAYRWFDGPSPTANETEANPNKGACGTGAGACASTTSFNNAGKLTGVTTVYQPLSYFMMNREWRNMAESQSGLLRAADFNVYWGAGGTIDSVIDVTHNIVVPFQATNLSTGWAVLNAAGQGAGGFDGRPTVLTALDWTCVEPFRSLGQPDIGFFPCTSGAPFTLSNTVVPGPVAFGAGDQQSTTQPQSMRNPSNTAAGAGFSIYISGSITVFELTGGALPAAGTVWAHRTYAGVVRGGRGGP